MSSYKRLCNSSIILLIALMIPNFGLVNLSQTRNIDTFTQDYLIAERNLWRLIHSTDMYNRYSTLSHIYKTHQEYLGKDFGENGIFERLVNKWQHKDPDVNVWKITDGIQNINVTALNVYRSLDHQNYDVLPLLIEDIASNVPNNISTIVKLINYEFWVFVKNSSQICDYETQFILSENQVLIEYYREIVAALLKGYMLTQMTYMIWETNSPGVYRESAEKLREKFIFNISTIQDNVKFETRNSSRGMWACDLNDYFDRDTYIEISRFYQGYIDNELNLNNEDNCRLSCSDYTFTKHYECAEDTFCHKSNLSYPYKSKALCSGSVINCQFLDGDLNFCLAAEDSSRRYEFIKYDNGNVLGKQNDCPNMVRAKSWMRWFVFCSNCFCYCDEPGPLSDRYFSLRAVTSNIRENKIITGIAITKINRMIQFKIIERELLSTGQINTTDKFYYDEWKTAKPFAINDRDILDGIDYHTLSWDYRSIDLDTIIDRERVVTGVRFRVVDSHIRIEVRFTNFDYQTGRLKDLTHSQWIGNHSQRKVELKLKNPDRPTNAIQKSKIVFGENFYINFQPSDITKDAAQSTIPFVDATPIEAMAPLAGIGLHLRAQYGHGGFIAPKLIVFDSGLYITPINNFN